MLSTESTVLPMVTSGATESDKFRTIVRDYTDLLLTLDNDSDLSTDRGGCEPIVSLTPVAPRLVPPDIVGSVDTALRQ